MNKQNNIDEVKLYGLNLDKKMDEFIPKLNKYIWQRLLQIYSSINKIYFIDHEYDPPYDFSGSLYVDYDSSKEDLNNVSDILEQYAGYSLPTYQSGYGLNYPMYKEILEQEVEEKIREVFISLTETMYKDGLLAESLKEIHGCLDEMDIIIGLSDYMEEELGLPYCYNEVFKDIPAIKYNYSIKNLFSLYGKDLEYIQNQQNLYDSEYQQYISMLKDECDNIRKYDEFSNKVITKKDTDLLSKLNNRYNEREISLLTYFIVYKFSKSLNEKYVRLITDEVGSLRLNLKSKYKTEFEIKDC